MILVVNRRQQLNGNKVSTLRKAYPTLIKR